MALLRWSAYGTRSANLAGTALDSLAFEARSAPITWTNANNDPYAHVCIELGALFPSVNGGVVLIKRTTDGTATATFSSAQYFEALNPVSGAATVIFEMVRVTPGTNTFVVQNLAGTGVSFAASGNAFYVTPITERIVEE